MAQEGREPQRAESQALAEQRREPEAVLVPAADIMETTDSQIVIADMPGVDEKSVHILVERNVLTIAGRVEAESPEGFQLGYQELETGRFARQFILSDEVDVNGIEASVLHADRGVVVVQDAAPAGDGMAARRAPTGGGSRVARPRLARRSRRPGDR